LKAKLLSGIESIDKNLFNQENSKPKIRKGTINALTTNREALHDHILNPAYYNVTYTCRLIREKISLIRTEELENEWNKMLSIGKFNLNRYVYMIHPKIINELLKIKP